MAFRYAFNTWKPPLLSVKQIQTKFPSAAFNTFPLQTASLAFPHGMRHGPRGYQSPLPILESSHPLAPIIVASSNVRKAYTSLILLPQPSKDPHTAASMPYALLLVSLVGIGYLEGRTSRDYPADCAVLLQHSVSSQPSSNAVDAQQKPPHSRIDTLQPGNFIEGLPVYTRAQVAEHAGDDTGVWVTYKQGVYDISEFMKLHPGGMSRIKLAAGASIDPFWAMYAQHQTAEVYEILEKLRIGNLDPAEISTRVEQADDPYRNDPQRHPALAKVSLKPFNAETPVELLADNFITPNDLFFVRNHLPVPTVDAEGYTLKIRGLGVQKEVRFTLEELKEKFQKHHVAATLQCAGNRRSNFRQVKAVKGLAWGNGAISTAIWGGASLREVLEYCGVCGSDMESLGIEHIQFEGLDMDSEQQHYGASVPAATILLRDSDALLAYEMNGEALPRDHGYPVRAILPGVVGARNVKWLDSIVVSDEESPSFWQQRDYRSFSPSVDWSTVDWHKAPAIQEYPIQSGICSPPEGTVIDPDEDTLDVKGYAWSGGGRAIIRVEVSLNGGETWHEAKLQNYSQHNEQQTSQVSGAEGDVEKDDESDEKFKMVTDWHKRRVDKAWSWVLWNVKIPVPVEIKGKTIEICCRAVDASYNTQPEAAASVWNLRGCLCNCWHRINITVPMAAES